MMPDWQERIRGGPCADCQCPAKPTRIEAANCCPFLGPPLDFVYLYIHSAAAGEELRYSIRSVLKNYLGPARIWVVGDKPEWYQGLYVPLRRIRKKRGQARLDRANKFHHIATAVPEINDRFVAMQDDIYFVNPVSYYDLNRRWVNGPPLTPEKIATWNPKHGYLKQQVATARALHDRGINYVSNYSTHTPKFYFKDDLARVIDGYEALTRPLVCTILFDNAIERIDNPFPIQPFRYRLKSQDHSTEEVLFRCRDKLFLNHLNESWTAATEKAVQVMFPGPTKIEAE